MKYKVGDILRVKSFEKILEYAKNSHNMRIYKESIFDVPFIETNSGILLFNDEKLQYCNKSIMIVDYYSAVDIDNKKSYYYDIRSLIDAELKRHKSLFWKEWMFENPLENMLGKYYEI